MFLFYEKGGILYSSKKTKKFLIFPSIKKYFFCQPLSSGEFTFSSDLSKTLPTPHHLPILPKNQFSRKLSRKIKRTKYCLSKKFRKQIEYPENGRIILDFFTKKTIGGIYEFFEFDIIREV